MNEDFEFKEITGGIVRRIPPKHWLPILVVAMIVAGITVVVVFKFTTDMVDSVAGAKHDATSTDSDEREEPAGDQSMQKAAEDVANAPQGNAPATPVTTKENGGQLAPPPEPAEPMVPESTVRLFIETINEMDRRHSNQLARRDKQIEDLNEKLNGMQDRLNDQQEVLAAIQSKQLQQAWDIVEDFRERRTSEIHGRTDTIEIREQNGTQPNPQTTPVRNDPFVSVSRPSSPRVSSPRTSRRTGYTNVSSKRPTVSYGFPAGSAKTRLQNKKDRIDGAYRWTRKYRNRSASSRLLGEMESGNR